MFTPTETPIIILTDGALGSPLAKVATGVITYGEWPVVAVIDKPHAGKTVKEATGIENGANIPIVATLEEALKLTKDGQKAKALLIGTAPQGGGLNESWMPVLENAVRHGLHIINGLHDFLTRRMDLVQLALTHKVLLWDVRDPDKLNKTHWWPIAKQKPRPTGTKVITMVGSDCSVGKMFTALELTKSAQRKGRLSSFVATGQTGMLIAGRGVPLDRVIGDFMAGYTESCVFEAIENDHPEWVFVEGQGSLLHPGYSGVTLSLMHGSNPDALILCHNPTVTHIKGGYNVPIPPLVKLIEIYTTAAHWIDIDNGPRPKIVGISLNTSAMTDADARKYIADAEKETGLPVTDPVRYGVASLIAALEKAFA